MTGSISSVREKLGRILSCLDDGPLYAISAENQAMLRRRAAGLLGELDRMEHTNLIVGLLGGTGAGKSTIINALAAEKISSSSHRRPHTDRAVVYRHEFAPAPDLQGRRIPFIEIIHRRDSIRHIVVCDLPDFDSIEENHREAVTAFLSELDIVVWITTPEKYADARFYRFLDGASRSRDNFLFVLNKVDVLFEGVDAAEGYDRLSKVSAGLAENLSNLGIPGAGVYHVSALEALNRELSPWNQFTAFRSLLFKHRDARTVAAIKTSNIESEASGVMDALQEEARVARACLRVVERAAAELRSGSPAACRPPDNPVPAGVDRRLRGRLPGGSLRRSALVGPGSAIELAAGWLRGISRREGADRPPAAPEEMTIAFRICVEWFRDRFLREAIRENIPAGLRDRLTESLEPDSRVELLKVRLEELAAAAVEEIERPGNKMFRLRQRICYGLMLALLMVVLGSEPAWLRLVTAPDMVAAFDLLLTFTHTLFSAQGLAALASYALVNVFLGFRFFRRYQRLLDRRAGEAAAVLGTRFRSAWHAAVEEAVDEFEEEAKRRLSPITAFSAGIPLEEHE